MSSSTAVDSGMSGKGPAAMSDDRRAKALEEHRRLVKEHRDKETKLRDCISLT